MIYLNNVFVRLAIVFALGLTAGMTINGWRLGAQIAQLEAGHAGELQAIAQVAANAAQQAVRQQTQAINSLAALDRKYTDEIAIAQSETDLLRNAVASGERRLRIQAQCPASSDRLPDAPATPGVDDAPSAKLTDTAERNYWLLRDRITIAANQVSALQDYITNVCIAR